MTKQQLENRDRFINRLLSTAEHNGKKLGYLDAIKFADWLHRNESTLNRIAIEQCTSNNYDAVKQERIEKRVVNAIAETIGCKCYTQRDPRGFAIRLYLVDEDGCKWFNGFDGETSGCNW